MRTLLKCFPAHKPNNSAINIFAESYGGRYGPAVTSFFEEQNERILNGSLTDTGETHVIHLDTLGIINGCVDLLTQAPTYPEFAHKNPYGIEAINKTVYEAAMAELNKPETGCKDLVIACQQGIQESDASLTAANDTVNEVCSAAAEVCRGKVEGPYGELSGRNVYDISAIDPTAFPPNYYYGYLESAWVQQALGVATNWSQSNNAVFTGFGETGDYAKGGYIKDLEYLLERGVKVSLQYGDRDYICNWFGGQDVSLAINHTAAPDFRKAGYENITVNETYVGGMVRQHGNLSFARVYQAGHEVPAYQPETALRIFERAVLGKDLATGQKDTNTDSGYHTEGPESIIDVKNVDEGSPERQCYLWTAKDTCTEEQQELLVNGTGYTVKDYILTEDEHHSGKGRDAMHRARMVMNGTSGMVHNETAVVHHGTATAAVVHHGTATAAVVHSGTAVVNNGAGMIMNGTSGTMMMNNKTGGGMNETGGGGGMTGMNATGGGGGMTGMNATGGIGGMVMNPPITAQPPQPSFPGAAAGTVRVEWVWLLLVLTVGMVVVL